MFLTAPSDRARLIAIISSLQLFMIIGLFLTIATKAITQKIGPPSETLAATTNTSTIYQEEQVRYAIIEDASIEFRIRDEVPLQGISIIANTNNSHNLMLDAYSSYSGFPVPFYQLFASYYLLNSNINIANPSQTQSIIDYSNIPYVSNEQTPIE